MTKASMTSEIKLAMVGYFNTIPFLFGLEKGGGEFEISLDYPARCIEYFNEGKVDVALVPLATILNRTDYKIITDYCIGCNGVVRTVCLFSNEPIKEITKIYLDSHSRTSQLLTKIICQEFWEITPKFEEVDIHESRHKELNENEAVLKIGDKVFDVEHNYKYKYDLGEVWKKWKSLPFAFAVWISKPSLSQDIEQKLNVALKYGVDHLDEAVQTHKSKMSHINIEEYFSKNIDYKLNDQKLTALELYKTMAEQILAKPVSVH